VNKNRRRTGEQESEKKNRNRERPRPRSGSGRQNGKREEEEPPATSREETLTTSRARRGRNPAGIESLIGIPPAFYQSAIRGAPRLRRHLAASPLFPPVVAVLVRASLGHVAARLFYVARSLTHVLFLHRKSSVLSTVKYPASRPPRSRGSQNRPPPPPPPPPPPRCLPLHIANPANQSYPAFPPSQKHQRPPSLPLSLFRSCSPFCSPPSAPSAPSASASVPSIRLPGQPFAVAGHPIVSGFRDFPS